MRNAERLVGVIIRLFSFLTVYENGSHIGVILSQCTQVCSMGSSFHNKIEIIFWEMVLISLDFSFCFQHRIDIDARSDDIYQKVS